MTGRAPIIARSPCCGATSRLRLVYDDVAYLRCTACLKFWERPAQDLRLVWTQMEPIEGRKRKAPRLKLI